MAIEMGEKSWTLLFSDGKPKANGQLRVHQVVVEGDMSIGKIKALFVKVHGY